MIWAAATAKLLKAIPLSAWLILAAVAALALSGLWLRSHWIGVGEARVQAQWEAERIAVREAAYAKGQADEAAMAQVRADMLGKLGWVLQKSEEQRYVYIDRITTIYRDHPVPASCVRPEPAGRLLAEAIAGANRAAQD